MIQVGEFLENFVFSLFCLFILSIYNYSNIWKVYNFVINSEWIKDLYIRRRKYIFVVFWFNNNALYEFIDSVTNHNIEMKRKKIYILSTLFLKIDKYSDT